MLGELTDKQMERLLREEAVGRIGCHANGRTYVVPVTYVWEGEAVYCQSADGMKIRMMRANPEVCFEVDHIDDLANWRSVIAHGTFEELQWEPAQHGMELLINRYKPLTVSETARGFESGSGAANADKPFVIFRIKLHEKTGRFENQ